MFLLFLLICFKQTKTPPFIQAFKKEQKKVIIQGVPGSPRLPAKPGNLADSLILEARAEKIQQEKHLLRAPCALFLQLLTSTPETDVLITSTVQMRKWSQVLWATPSGLVVVGSPFIPALLQYPQEDFLFLSELKQISPITNQTISPITNQPALHPIFPCSHHLSVHLHSLTCWELSAILLFSFPHL